MAITIIYAVKYVSKLSMTVAVVMKSHVPAVGKRKKKVLRLVLVERALNSSSSWFTGTQLKYFERNNSNTTFKRIKNPNWQETTSWLFTNVAKVFNSGQLRTNPASGQSRTQTRDHWIVSPTG